MVQQLIVINPKDNVGMAAMDLQKGQEIKIEADGNTVVIILQSNINFGHKAAIKDIKKGSPIYKYGEEMGVAIEDISLGEHVHVHNVVGQRGRGDLNS